MPRLSPAEKQFLTQLLAGHGKEFMKRTAGSIVHSVILDPKLPQDPTSAHAGAAQRRTIEELLVGPDSPLGLKMLRPEFLRLAPPLFLRDDEMIWQDPVDLSHITYT